MPPVPTVQIRALQAEDRASAAQLLRTTEDQGYSAEYLKWKYAENPQGAGVCLIATQDDSPIGVSGAFPCTCSVDGALQQFWLNTDCVVHRDFRGRGVFRALLEETQWELRATQACVGFGFMSPMSRGSFEKVAGYRFAGCVNYLFTLLAPPSAQSPSVKARVGGHSLGLLPGRRQSLRAAARAEVTALDWANPDPRILPLLAEPADKHALCLLKDADFLRWRFGRHPWHEYEGWLVCLGGEAVGYVVLRDANVIDLRGHDRPEVWQALVGVTLDRASQKGCCDLHLYCSGPAGLLRALRRAGFLQWQYSWRPRGLYPEQVMMAGYLQEEPLSFDLWNLQNWSLQMADLDCGL